MPSFARVFLPFAKTNSFDKIILDYLNDDEFLQKFYAFEDNQEGIRERIASYKNHRLDRNSLKEIILNQYSQLGIELSGKVLQNINSLANQDTFTITSGHQLNIFGGPLYIIYKLLSAINLAEKIKILFPSMSVFIVYSRFLCINLNPAAA